MCESLRIHRSEIYQQGFAPSQVFTKIHGVRCRLTFQYIFTCSKPEETVIVWNETNVPDICGPVSPGICFILVVCQMSLWRSMSRGSRGSSRIISNRNNRFPKRFQNGENQYFGFIGRRWESLVVILEIKSSTVRFHLTNKPFYRSQPLFTAVNPRSILWKSFWAPFLSLWSSSPTWIWDFVDLSPFEAIQGPLFCIVWFQGGQKWPHWPKDFK